MIRSLHLVLRGRTDLDIFPVSLNNYITHMAIALKRKADAVSNRPFFLIIILFTYLFSVWAWIFFALLADLHANTVGFSTAGKSHQRPYWILLHRSTINTQEERCECLRKYSWSSRPWCGRKPGSEQRDEQLCDQPCNPASS